ncbi:MAG: MCE family protein [Planctomycetes bacterium]|nr:MCE family protein [Planctomycetota bacterium]
MRSPVSRPERLAAYFVLLVLIVLAALILVPRWRATEAESFWDFLSMPAFVLHVIADDAVDLAQGDKVLMKGIQVGEISGIDFSETQKVIISCSIYRRYTARIPWDSKFFLVPAPIVGRGKIEIQPGTGSALGADTKVPGLRYTSFTDRVDGVLQQAAELLVQMRGILEQAGASLAGISQRVVEMERTLASLQKILDQVTEGRGALGQIVFRDDLYSRIESLVERLESAARGFETLREPVTDFGERLPSLTRTAAEAAEKLNRTLDDLERGMKHFPDAASSLAASLVEGRKVLESLKRNFLIRGNLPRDLEPETMAPASRRESLSLEMVR